jgi:uncharacterized repeat protein (TIGR01451 family)
MLHALFPQVRSSPVHTPRTHRSAGGFGPVAVAVVFCVTGLLGASAAQAQTGADLVVTKAGPTEVAIGPDPQTITYTITVDNIGTITAANVTVVDPTPAGLTLVSVRAEPFPEACQNAFPCVYPVVWTTSHKVITAVYRVPSCTELPPGVTEFVNTVRATSADDTTPANNEATVRTSIRRTVCDTSSTTTTTSTTSTTIPPTTSPATTAPATTAPATTSPATTATTAPVTTAPVTTAPVTTASATTLPIVVVVVDPQTPATPTPSVAPVATTATTVAATTTTVRPTSTLPTAPPAINATVATEQGRPAVVADVVVKRPQVAFTGMDSATLAAWASTLLIAGTALVAGVRISRRKW